MKLKKKLSRTREAKLDEYYSQFKVYCKCGHSLLMKPSEIKVLCSHCGNYHYVNEREKFKAWLYAHNALHCTYAGTT